MVNISSTNSAYKPIGKFMNYMATRKWLKTTMEKAYKEPAKYTAKAVVISLVSKDVINTCVYTYQSLNNERIPKEKRSFVAANDLVLGFFNFAGQLIMAKLFEKHITPKIQSLYTGHIKDANDVDQYTRSKAPLSPDNIHQYTQEVIKEQQAKLKDLKPEELQSISKDVIKKLGGTGSKGKDIATGIAVIVTALATTALVKRTISPLFSTPIAGWLGDKWDKKGKDKADQAKIVPVASDVIYSQNKVKNGDKVEISKEIAKK